MGENDVIVVTGAAGFVGQAVAAALLDRGERVIGVDNFNDYYDPSLKEARAALLAAKPGFDLERMDIADAEAFSGLVQRSGARRIVHLAAQAGVRYADAFAYGRSNLTGHLSVLEACRGVADFRHLVYASSSSVYGDRPLGRAFREDDVLEPPTSLYAATKRADELISASYAHLYGLPQTGLRFFTVYGPWGRPDMAYFSFARSLMAGEPIEVFGEGAMSRDFTYIDDIVEGVVQVLDRPPEGHRVLNIGAGRPVEVKRMIAILEDALGVTAQQIALPKPPADVTATFADVSALAALTGYRPKVALEDGLARFVAWVRDYYG
jgi:UDP-glucuronate 4-epimerase